MKVRQTIIASGGFRAGSKITRSIEVTDVDAASMIGVRIDDAADLHDWRPATDQEALTSDPVATVSPAPTEGEN